MEGLGDFVEYANQDEHAEFEAKLLAGKILTKDSAERIRREILSLSGSVPVEEHRLTYTYQDGIRVNVIGPDNIHRVCTTRSFAKIPVIVEKKTRYFQESPGKKDMIDDPEFYTRYTLRHEKFIRNDHSGQVEDPKAFIRMIHRLSYTTPSGEFRIDFSMVKSRNQGDSLATILRLPAAYELEVEYLPQEQKRPKNEILESMKRILMRALGAFQGSPFILPASQIARYADEFGHSGIKFYNLVTMDRRNLREDRPGSITRDYTVTNKADGERCGLYVSKDRHILRVDSKGRVVWTGIRANDDRHAGDFLDGEYLPDFNLFCIFDVYTFRSKNVKGLPLFTTDEDIQTNPESSRLGCARLFIADLQTDFISQPSDSPTMRVETKLFLAGDGIRMEESIQKILDTKFEYPIDGLIFTPRSSPVAPLGEMTGNTWTRVYKWKPPSQNSIDFLVRLDETSTMYDSELKQDVREGMLFISRTPGQDVTYPCETMTGEFIPPPVPRDLTRASGTRAPAAFQPSAPRDPDAYKIKIPLNGKKIPVDIEGHRVESDTIIECSFDVDTRRWSVMRTRYDKTYQYRVLRQQQYGNDIKTAENVWTSIHVPVTEDMIRSFVTQPPDDTFEDDLYYRDDLDSRDRILKQVYSFHNRIKDSLYKTYVRQGSTLLELAAGRGGDLFKWMRAKPATVIGLDISQTNLSMPRQGACARYLVQKALGRVPDILFAQADMTKPFEEQENKYLKIMMGTEAPETPYLRKFAALKLFDSVSCQFAMNYACESEEMFGVFLTNVSNHCKDMFFGTVLDGAATYGLLVGKNKHIFRKGTAVFAEIDKSYTDTGSWTDEFGLKIDVMLESLEKPQSEFLVPFDKITGLFQAAGFKLVKTEMFSDIYSSQKDITLGASEQEFSFLYRTFAFKKVAAAPLIEREVEIEVPVIEPAAEPEAEPEAEPAAEPAAEPVAEETVAEPAAEPVTEVVAAVEKKPRKKRAVKPDVPEGPPPEPPVFFFSKLPENKEFSNFFPVEFEMDGVKFASAEHAFQYMKAMTFGDQVHADKILKAKSAQSAKSFGKKVSNFVAKTWDDKKIETMLAIIRAKFRSNPELRKKLLETGTRPLAEANNRDSFWGIGMSGESEKAKDLSKWPKDGNHMGKILEQVRTELRAEA